MFEEGEDVALILPPVECRARQMPMGDLPSAVGSKVKLFVRRVPRMLTSVQQRQRAANNENGALPTAEGKGSVFMQRHPLETGLDKSAGQEGH